MARLQVLCSTWLDHEGFIFLNIHGTRRQCGEACCEMTKDSSDTATTSEFVIFPLSPPPQRHFHPVWKGVKGHNESTTYLPWPVAWEERYPFPTGSIQHIEKYLHSFVVGGWYEHYQKPSGHPHYPDSVTPLHPSTIYTCSMLICFMFLKIRPVTNFKLIQDTFQWSPPLQGTTFESNPPPLQVTTFESDPHHYRVQHFNDPTTTEHNISMTSTSTGYNISMTPPLQGTTFESDHHHYRVQHFNDPTTTGYNIWIGPPPLQDTTFQWPPPLQGTTFPWPHHYRVQNFHDPTSTGYNISMTPPLQGTTFPWPTTTKYISMTPTTTYFNDSHSRVHLSDIIHRLHYNDSYFNVSFILITTIRECNILTFLYSDHRVQHFYDPLFWINLQSMLFNETSHTKRDYHNRCTESSTGTWSYWL